MTGGDKRAKTTSEEEERQVVEERKGEGRRDKEKRYNLKNRCSLPVGKGKEQKKGRGSAGLNLPVPSSEDFF